jgi:hypothetical protein
VREVPGARHPDLNKLGFGVYWRMCPLAVGWGLLMMFAVIVGMSMAAIVSVYVTVKTFVVTIAVCASIALWIVLWLVSRVRAYRRFKTFPGDLKIPFDGWAELISDPKVLRGPDQWWDRCEIEVSGELTAPVIAALDRFVKRANGRQYYVSYYDRTGGADSRKPWTRVDRIASGSYNIETVGEIYRLVRALDELRAGGVVARVSGDTFRYTKK